MRALRVIAVVSGLCLPAGCQGGGASSPRDWWTGRSAESQHPPAPAGTGTPTEPDHQIDGEPSRNASPEATSVRPTEESTPLPPAPAGSVVPPLLTINQEAITVEDILEPVRPRLERAAAKLARDEYYALLIQLVRQQLIDEISERLIYGEARREIGEEQDKAIEAAVDRIEQERINDEFAGRESRYEQYLADLKKSRADVRERLRRRVVVARYLRDRLLPRVSVRKRDLQKYYETHRSEFTQNRQVELFMIDVPFVAFLETDQPPTEAEKAAARRRARAHAAGCKAKIEAGATFEEVAREDSFGLHREEGGSWGFISAPLRGRYEIPSRVALGLDSGRVSDVIETDSGYFLVQAGRVVGGSTRRFEEVQAEITERLRQEQFAELRRDFVQRTLARAAVSDIEPFVRTVVARAPESGRAASGGSPRP